MAVCIIIGDFCGDLQLVMLNRSVHGASVCIEILREELVPGENG